ncbi:hypothetical protein HYR99_17695 [Candidatus Poribacteria bacterium]|nr:hypothetical protein [Candidatus Poribacteria bacterium]
MNINLSPIDFHYHGIDGFGLARSPDLILNEVEEQLKNEGVKAIVTLSLPKSQFSNFLALMNQYSEGLKDGRYIYIVGIALEGPVLASRGGTPEQGVWMPTVAQWTQIAARGQGLKYVVLSPDAHPPSSGTCANQIPTSIGWIVNTLMDGGVLPALGHFSKTDPEVSVDAITGIFDVVKRRGGGPIITDHLFNDMPRNFKHAWRTQEERNHRSTDLLALDLPSWNLKNIEQRMGPVPAALLHGAKGGILKLCLNFDGEHVDLEISKRTIEILGSEHLMIMTDRIPNGVSGGQQLHQPPGSTLLYQNQGIVAGGSQSLSQQIQNMRSIGIAEEDIRNIVCLVPAGVLKIPPDFLTHQTTIASRARRVS